MGSRLAGKVAFVSGAASGLGDLQDGRNTKAGTETGRASMAGINRTGASRGMKAAAPDARKCSTRANMIYPGQIRTLEPGDLTPERDAARRVTIPMHTVGDPMDVANR
jgi:NAD(P)-dependent dehydrogenase (short-subunit alcohol dehydrogenase family)